MGSDLLHQARKYRAAAYMLAPNLSQVKAQYIARAAELEQQAGAAGPDPKPLICSPDPKPLICSPDPALPKLNTQTRVHTDLALAVHKDKGKNIHGAYSIWLALRAQAKRHFDKGQVLKFYAAEFNRTERTIRRWLAAGDGVFWTFGKKSRLSLRGKDSVFQAFNLLTPGKVLLVDTDTLTGKLSTLKASLYATFTGGQESKWASRATLEKITGVAERTQLNYDKINHQRKQKTFALGFTLENSSSTARQMPNRYHAKWYPAHIANSGKGRKKYGLYTPDNNAVASAQDNLCSGTSIATGFTVNGKTRTLFDNGNRALQAAAERTRCGLSGECFMALSGTTKRGNLLLKPLTYGV